MPPCFKENFPANPNKTDAANIIWKRILCPLRNTNIFPATNVCLTSQNTRPEAFDCALHGPFDKLRSAGSQPSRLSVSATSAVISTSTVFYISIFYFQLFCILTLHRTDVNAFFLKIVEKSFLLLLAYEKSHPRHNLCIRKRNCRTVWHYILNNIPSPLTAEPDRAAQGLPPRRQARTRPARGRLATGQAASTRPERTLPIPY